MQARQALGVAMVAGLLVLGGCGDRVENSEIPQPEQANVEINRQGMEGAKDEKQAGGVRNDTAVMGAAPESALGEADARIVAEVKARLAEDRDLAAMKIDVHSQDGMVTLRGRAPDPLARDRAGELARAVGDVKTVDNQLTLG